MYKNIELHLCNQQYFSDSESIWKCTHCDFSTKGHAVRKVLQIIQAEVDAVEAISGADGADAIHERENIMKKYRSVLHPRHAFLSMLRYGIQLSDDIKLIKFDEVNFTEPNSTPLFQI